MPMPTPYWLNGPHRIRESFNNADRYPLVHVADGELTKYTRAQLIDLIEEMNILIRAHVGAKPNDGPWSYVRSGSYVTAEGDI